MRCMEQSHTLCAVMKDATYCVNLCRLQCLSHTTQGLLLQRRSIPVLLYIASRTRTQHSLPCTSQGLYSAEVPLRHITTNLEGTAALTKDHTSARYFSGVVDCCCMGLRLAEMYPVFEVSRVCPTYVTAAKQLLRLPAHGLMFHSINIERVTTCPN
jgi:hypothetical protein